MPCQRTPNTLPVIQMLYGGYAPVPKGWPNVSQLTRYRPIPRTSSGLELPRGTDGRTRSARRFRDLYEAFASGLSTPLTEPEKGLVRQAVGLQILSEIMQEKIVAGEMVDPDQAIRIAGTSRRLLQIVAGRTGKRDQPIGPSLADIFSVPDDEAETDDVEAVAE